MAGLRTKALAFIVLLFFSGLIGVFTGIKNNSDYQVEDYQFEELSADVRVYRDENFVPTIIAENEFDLFFAQGYEMSRDRLWQLEFFRSIANGELSRLFGDGLVDADKNLRTLSMGLAAERVESTLEDEYLEVIDAFVQGLNKYIRLHQNNLPTEFSLLGVKPKQWTVKDVLSIQGVLSRTLSISGLNRELFRNNMAQEFGPERATELYDIEDPTAKNYYLSLNSSDLAPLSNFQVDLSPLTQWLEPTDFDGSNNWVVGPENSGTNSPLLANDPHLSLQTPGIWWQVHLYSPTFHVQGFALPGTPGIIVGNNDNIAWGVTNTGLDATDIFYFKTNDQNQYWLDGEWKDLTTKEHEIEVSDGDTELYTVEYTEYGPVLDPEVFSGIPEDSDYIWTLRWTLLEGYDHDRIFKAVLDYNRATSAEEFLNALEYFTLPAQNFVFATVDGDYGYQFTGAIPTRTTPGAGVIPQNGSDSSFGWNGVVPYEDLYRVVNPEKGYFATANQKIDTRDNFYITDVYALPNRGNRINSFLDGNSSMTISAMHKLQDDTYNLYAKKLLDTTFSEIEEGTYSDDIDDDANDAISMLEKWNYRMDRNETGATIFALYRIFLEEQTFLDEFAQAEILDYDDYHTRADYGLTAIIDNPNSAWFDDVTTEGTETRSDIVERAFDKAISYLVNKISNRQRNWNYGNVHTVVFEHPLGEQSIIGGFFNEGETASDGSEHTVKAAGGTPGWDNTTVDFVQTHGSSMRYIANVESSWSEVFGIAPPGQSEHFFVGHRGDNVDDWVNGVTHRWNFSHEFDEVPDFTFVSAN